MANWHGKKIDKASDFKVLEGLAIKHEMSGLHHDPANEAAYAEYLQNKHLDAAKHHFDLYRNAVVCNNRELANLHKLFWQKHAAKANVDEKMFEDANKESRPEIVDFHSHKYDSKLV
jgi:hypothetical protein